MELRTAELNKPSGVAAINQWVSDHTAGLIPTILDSPLDGAVLVALNALHFKDAWDVQFKVTATSPQPFQLAGGGIKSVPMMRLSTFLRVRQDDRFVAVTLPYKTKGFSLVVLLSKGLPAKVEDYTEAADWLAAGELIPVNVDLSLPKFQTTMKAELLPDLDAIGLAAGHSPTAFSGFSAEPIDISAVIQKTLIKIDESGTEAAAATAVVMQPTVARAPPKPKPMSIVIDKPFLFALRDDATGFILLAGYVGDPTAE
jgi:serine protease inhibitor